MHGTTDAPTDQDLHELLQRWTAAGLIDAKQASRIEAAEAARPPRPADSSGRRRLPLVVEVLGYLGAVVAIAAGFVAVRQFWPHVPTGVELAFFGVTAVALTLAGGAIRTPGEPALARLRSVLWLMATASAAALASVIASRVLQMSDSDIALFVATTWTACAVPLWWRARSVLSHLAMFGGVVAVVLSGVGRLVTSPVGWEFGIALWAVSVLWGVAAWRGYLTPRTAGLAAAGAGVLVGAMMTMDTTAGPVFALVTVAGLLSMGVVFRQVLMLGLGAVGIIGVVPQAAIRYLPGSVAAPVAVALVGLLLLAIALWLARTRTRR